MGNSLPPETVGSILWHVSWKGPSSTEFSLCGWPLVIAPVPGLRAAHRGFVPEGSPPETRRWALQVFPFLVAHEGIGLAASSLRERLWTVWVRICSRQPSRGGKQAAAAKPWPGNLSPGKDEETGGNSRPAVPWNQAHGSGAGLKSWWRRAQGSRTEQLSQDSDSRERAVAHRSLSTLFFSHVLPDTLPFLLSHSSFLLSLTSQFFFAWHPYPWLSHSLYLLSFSLALFLSVFLVLSLLLPLVPASLCMWVSLPVPDILTENTSCTQCHTHICTRS